MGKGRLEAFSDGVIAIIITIMVLEVKVPHGTELADLVPLCAVLLSYLLSFVYVGIYWNNHHHLLHAAKRISGGVMWANLHLLFWLSLVPVVTNWVGENPNASIPVASYGFVLLMSGLAWLILQNTLVARNGGRNSTLARALGRDTKGTISAVGYIAALGLAFVKPWLAEMIYLAMAILWVVPDRRIERVVHDDDEA